MPGADRFDTPDADQVLVAGQFGASSSITPSSPLHFSITEIVYLSIKSALALHPILKRLGIPKAGLHAFRHSRVTMLRKNGTPDDLQKQWIGHYSLRTTDRYSHTHQELEYRRLAASKVGLNFDVGPNGPNLGSALAK